MSASEWADFFDGHAPAYDENIFTRNSPAEVSFLVQELDLKPGAAILDVGCGTGRHAVELARRGFRVTGVDISAGMLAGARKKADAAGVQVAWFQADATHFVSAELFDAVICLCEGAFGLLSGADDALGQPAAILRTVAAAMKPGVKCLFTVLNGFRMARQFKQEDVAADRFNPRTLTEASACAPGRDSPMRERGFVPTELVLLFGGAGLNVLHVWGGTAGNWRRGPVELDEMEIMVVAQKPAAR
jgi:SAM-dependent methyltransferase